MKALEDTKDEQTDGGDRQPGIERQLAGDRAPYADSRVGLIGLPNS